MKEAKHLLMFFYIITFLGSCTVQKRVHMSGYHVEFGRQKASFSKKSLDLPLSTIQEAKFQSSSQNSKIMELDTEVLPSKSDDLTDDLTSTSTATTFEKEIFNAKIGKEIKQTIPQSQQEPYHKIQKKEKSTLKTVLPEGRNNGVTILIMSILFFLLAFVFFYYLGVIGLIFSIIFLVAGLLLFLLGLFRLIFG